MMAEITDQVPGQERLDEIQDEQQDEEVPSIPGQEVVPPEPEFISETLYIQNLNDRVKLPYMKATLNNLFRHYGKVIDVVAHHNVRMRGQAFVSFPDAEIAQKAMREVKGFPLYGKPLQLSFAKTRSEAVVKALDPTNYETYHQERLKHKKRARWDNPHTRKAKAKKEAIAAGAEGVTAGPKKPVVQMPDEYLPPNKILFIQNLPVDTTKDQLNTLFSQYDNLLDVRVIPAKKDIAFVEYMDERSATVAKEALHNYKIDGENKIKITYARK